MSPKAQLQSILNEKYVSEDGDEYEIEFKAGLTSNEIEGLVARLPKGHIPDEIRTLLQFARGFDFAGMEEITFDAFGEFGFEEFFPNSVQLAGDGAGNFWIIDIDNDGNWNHVFYVCHDPAVIVKQSDNLAQFIEQISEFGKNEMESTLHFIQEQAVLDIWENNNGLTELEEAKASGDSVLKNFALSLPDHFVIADLRNKPVRSGFAWGKFGLDTANVLRHETELLWGIERKVKKGLPARLFGR